MGLYKYTYAIYSNEVSKNSNAYKFLASDCISISLWTYFYFHKIYMVEI